MVKVIDERLIWESGNCFNLQYHIMETCVDNIPTQNTDYWLMVGNFYNGVVIVDNPYTEDFYETEIFHCTEQEFCEEFPFEFETYEELRNEYNLDYLETQFELMEIMNEMRDRIKIVTTKDFIEKCYHNPSNVPKVWNYKYKNR